MQLRGNLTKPKYMCEMHVIRAYVYVHMRLKHIMNRKYLNLRAVTCGPAATCAWSKANNLFNA